MTSPGEVGSQLGSNFLAIALVIIGLYYGYKFAKKRLSKKTNNKEEAED